MDVGKRRGTPMRRGDEQLRKAIVDALRVMLRRRRDRADDPAGVLDGLRAELHRVMAEAPISGPVVQAVAARARIAALCDEEIGKVEARLRAGERLDQWGGKGPTDPDEGT